MSVLTRLAWRRMSEQDRVDVVEGLLRNRAMMLDPKGRPMPGLSIFPGLAPTDDEFRARAREIVATTGKDQVAAMRQVDAFEDDLAVRVDRYFEEFEKSLGQGDNASRLPPPPPPD